MSDERKGSRTRKAYGGAKKGTKGARGKELRKKAIPKAHEVPKWYKEAPKRRIERPVPSGDEGRREKKA